MLPAGDATPRLVPATVLLPALRPETFLVAVPVPARLAVSCELARVAPETERLAGEAARPPFTSPLDRATVERPWCPLEYP